jgi:TetR/AcrR family transcriptional regulator
MKKLTQTSEEKILDAAKNVFMKYGLYGSRMQDIADTAGINKALLHYYFRSKEKLFDRIFENALHKYFESINVFTDSTLPVKEQIFKYVENSIDFYAEYPQITIFIINEMSISPDLFQKKIQAIKKEKNIKMIEALEKAIAKGEIKKIDTTLFFINLQSLCSYPFIAKPIFKYSLKANNKDYDKDFSPEKLKIAVKHFIESSLSKK